VVLILLFCWWGGYSLAEEQVEDQQVEDQEVYDVNVIVEDTSRRLPADQACILRIASLRTAKSEHVDARVNEGKVVSLPEGRYQVNVLIENPRHDAIAFFDVPATATIRLSLQKAGTHHLEVKVVDAERTPIEGCRVQLSIVARLVFRGLPTFIGSDSGPSKMEVTDPNGLATFDLRGPVRECNLRILDQQFTRSDKSTVPLPNWDSNEPFVVKVLRKVANGEIKCFVRKEGETYPLVDVVNDLLGTEARLVVGRIVMANPEPGKKNRFDLRFEDGLLPLYGLEDGEYFIRRVDVSGRGAHITLYALRNEPISIKNSRLSEAHEQLVLAEKAERQVPVTITVTHGGRGIPGASVSLTHPLESQGGTTDPNGRCSVELAEGRYTLQVRHGYYGITTQEVYIGKGKNTIEVNLAPLPVLKGRITLEGKPVKPDHVIVFFDVDRYRYPGRFDANGNYEVPLKKSGCFVLGVTFDGFTEFCQLNSPEATSKDINFEVTPRREITLQISGTHASIIRDKANLLIFPKGVGIPAASYEILKSGVATINIIDGKYRLFLFVSEEKIYDLGMIEVAKIQKAVQLRLDKKPKSIDANGLIERLRREFKKKRKWWIW